MPEYNEPVLQPLGKLRDLTFKSGEKASPEKSTVEKATHDKAIEHH